MRTDSIIEIGIHADNRLYIKPERERFDYIYRSAAEVHWDNKDKFLYSPTELKGWTYYDWFQHIIVIVKDECDCQLNITGATNWVNISNELKAQICGNNISISEPSQLRQQLISKTDLEWFDSICDMLKKEAKPTTHRFIDIIGTEKPNPNNQIRGSKFLNSYDKRFDGASINPDLKDDEANKPLSHLGFWGEKFKIKIGDIVERFKTFSLQSNIYDGGTQIFFYPVPEEYEFTAISFWTELDINSIDNIFDIEVNDVTFKFGDKLILLRDGYTMKMGQPTFKMISAQEIFRKRPVWYAISEFYLDIELGENDIKRIALILKESKYSIEELKRINYEEVAPVVSPNLMSTAGVWSGFDKVLLEDEIVKRINSKRSKSIFNWIYRKNIDWMTKRYWKPIQKIIEPI